MRPLLVLATAEALNASLEQAYTPACAIEMVHTYSLIHDDLPCMDNDDFRRGKPSLHKVYPEWHALLAGDYLLTYAFEILTQSTGLTDQQKVQLVSTLAMRAGGEGMVGGQLIDMAAEGLPMTVHALQKMHSMKTGALLVACLEFGAIVGHASASQLHTLRQFGEKIGLAFQIVDDILDVTASEVKHGKAVSSDQINQKVTYVTLLGLERCREEAETLYQEAVALIQPFKGRTEPLLGLASQILNRSS
jgi:geranylgeranyl diphosphate synthase type II